MSQFSEPRVTIKLIYRIESHVALPSERRSDYRYCGEEDAHGDPHALIDTAAVIEPVAASLREALARQDSEVAILTARAHDASWLCDRLTTKLRLPRRLSLVQCVYSRDFEREVCDGTTAARKAAALDLLVARCRPRVVHFFDDVEENVRFAQSHFNDRATPRLVPHLIDFQHSLDALDAAGIDAADVFHPQCRDENDMNDLVADIQKSLSSSSLDVLKKLSAQKRPFSPPILHSATNAARQQQQHQQHCSTSLHPRVKSESMSSSSPYPPKPSATLSPPQPVLP